MNTTKLIAFIILGITMIGMTLADDPVNTCGQVVKPTNVTDCTAFNNKTSGDDCCYIEAYKNETQPDNSTVATRLSACFWKAAALNNSVVDEAAHELGFNSTYSCGSCFVAITSMVAFIFAFLF